MGEPLDATEMWAQALRALWEAAGKPDGATIGRQAAGQEPPLKVTTSSWSNWSNGVNVPANPKIAQWLVAFLRGRARQKAPWFVPPADGWWSRVWQQAREERQGKGGRPPTRHLPGKPPAEIEQVRVGLVPQPADCFQDRAVAARLERAVEEVGTMVAAQESTHVLAGMGGVGKTQVAAAYARKAWSHGVGLLVWVNAATRGGVISAYADAALRLGLPLAERDDPEHAAREFLAWAETTTERGWLIVLDDIRDMRDVAGLWPVAAGSVAGGQVLVTTRLRHAALTGAGRRMVLIDTFTSEEARSYLQARLGSRAADVCQVDALAGDLGYLPLALAQAAVYILNDDITIATYRERFATRLLPRALPTHEELPDDHEHIVAATWELSIDQAERGEPVRLARPVLQLASALDAAGIPQIVLTAPSALDYLTSYAAEQGQDLHVSAEMVDESLRVLHRHSLIEHDRTAPHREIRVHQLVQRVTRENLAAQSDLGDDLNVSLAATVADALLEVWPSPERNFLSEVLRANTAALDRVAGRALRAPGLHVLLFRIGLSLGESGQVTAARDYFQDLAVQATQLLGPDHLDTLAVRSNLARWRGEAGDPAGAVEAFAQLFNDELRVLGSDDPNVLTTRGNVANMRGEAGDAAGAAGALAELLADFLRVFGEDHPDTLATRGNLARRRGEAGDAAGAAEALAELLADFLRVFGEDHPDTLITRSNLAHWRGEAGDAAGAAEAFADLLDDQLRVYGPDHPDTLIARNNLAHWRGEAGDAASAAEEFAGLLDDRTRVLGPDHPYTLATRASLWGWRGEAGDATGAAEALTELLDDQLRVLGADHAYTLATRGEIARWRGVVGDAVGAVEAHSELLAGFLRVFGEDHPETLVIRGSLAGWRGEAGDAAGAAEVLAGLLDDHLRVFGPDDPGTLGIRADLAHWCGEAGDAAGAAEAYAFLLADLVRLLGPDHQGVLETRGKLAGWRGEAGDAAGAAGDFAELLDDQLRVLGPVHPNTLATRSELARWRGGTEV